VGTERIRGRLKKIERQGNLPVDPVAVCFIWPGETKEAAWRRHLELFPQAELSPYRAFIQVGGIREKQEARFYSYPISYECPEDEPLEFTDPEIAKGYLQLKARANELARLRKVGHGE
jgi:hypothetical protein